MHVVILHGWGQYQGLWQPVVSRLAEVTNVTAIDFPGFGEEPLQSTAWGVPEYADWAATRIAALGDDIVLVGHSFGGRVALELAARQPSWLHGLVLMGAPCVYRPSFALQMKKKLFHLGRRAVPAAVRDRLINTDLRDAEAAGLGEIFRRVVSYDQTELLRKVQVPTMLLWGERDHTAPLSIAREIRDGIPGAVLDVLPGLGHNPHMDNPVLVYGKIASYLQHL